MEKLKYIVLALAMLLATSLRADDLTPEQQRYRAALMQFLSEEGYSPSIDEEDDLVFKKEGELYWFSFSGNSGVYLEFHRAGFSFKDEQRALLTLAANESNRTTRCAKAIVNSSTMSFAVEIYSHSVEDFKYTLYDFMSCLDAAYETVVDYFNEHN